jgi:hypothetical protein
MVDYIEGILAIKQNLAALEEACRNNHYAKAQELCLAIIVETRSVNHHITIQVLDK